ncbi:hypothetical protein [Psychrobacter sp.]|uniref:hypothetical protein n=1 Tax=Psychrobacter sp. TaxID=56811 RepID=UPI003001DA5E|tara:strand:+ start:411 stop:638 length:228 start_codon:yes stop_codon:yes gene_type:complete
MNNKNQPKRELVVNWHITEACNYKCSYCFAKWNRQKNEVMNDEAATIRLLDEISKLLTPAVNPVELNLGDFSYAA